jgi:hypothetical protein
LRDARIGEIVIAAFDDFGDGHARGVRIIRLGAECGDAVAALVTPERPNRVHAEEPGPISHSAPTDRVCSATASAKEQRAPTPTKH